MGVQRLCNTPTNFGYCDFYFMNNYWVVIFVSVFYSILWNYLSILKFLFIWKSVYFGLSFVYFQLGFFLSEMPPTNVTNEFVNNKSRSWISDLFFFSSSHVLMMLTTSSLNPYPWLVSSIVNLFVFFLFTNVFVLCLLNCSVPEVFTFLSRSRLLFLLSICYPGDIVAIPMALNSTYIQMTHKSAT